MLLLLRAQPGEPAVGGCSGSRKHSLRCRIGGLGLLPYSKQSIAASGAELHAPHQRRVGVGLELGVGQVGNLAGLAVQLDQVRTRDLPKVRARQPSNTRNSGSSASSALRCT